MNIEFIIPEVGESQEDDLVHIGSETMSIAAYHLVARMQGALVEVEDRGGSDIDTDGEATVYPGTVLIRKSCGVEVGDTMKKTVRIQIGSDTTSASADSDWDDESSTVALSLDEEHMKLMARILIKDFPEVLREQIEANRELLYPEGE
jgi:hypothetical protein